MVLTAAAADKTSFGCRHSRDWTASSATRCSTTRCAAGAALMGAFSEALNLITKWESDVHATWQAYPAAQRRREPEPAPSNPQSNVGDAAAAAIAKAKPMARPSLRRPSHLRTRPGEGRPSPQRPRRYGNDHQRPYRRAGQGQHRRRPHRSPQDTAKAITLIATSALQLFPAQPTEIATHATQCMAP